jgi:polyhydroxyalkanoate synthesis regulator phasin
MDHTLPKTLVCPRPYLVQTRFQQSEILAPIPYLLITNGSTGSGKTIMASKTIEYLKLNPDNTKLLIDDLVEENDAYKVEALKILQGVQEQCNKNTEDVEKKYTHADNVLQQKFSNAYFMARRDVQCERSCCSNCDTLLDQMMISAIASHKNIVFETTGLKELKWLFSEMIKDQKYYVISAYTLVDVNLLRQRMTQRTLNSIRSFEANVHNNAPRLPDLNFEHIKKNQTKVIDNLVKAISELEWEKKNSLPQNGINRILVYNNSGPDMQIIYDSDRDVYTSAVRNLFLGVAGLKLTKARTDINQRRGR